MRTAEAARDEERLSRPGSLLDQLRHAPRRVGVNQLVLDRLELVPVPAFARVAVELAFGDDAVGQPELLRLLRLVDDLAVGRAFLGHVPALRHVAADVKHLADARGEVALLPEVLRQEHRVLQRRRARRAFVAEHPRLLRPPPAQERHARRAAHRILAVGAVESHRPRRQPIHVRRFHDRVAVARQAAVQVVGDDEQHVELGRLCGDEGSNQEHEGVDGLLDRLHGAVFHCGSSSRVMSCSCGCVLIPLGKCPASSARRATGQT